MFWVCSCKWAERFSGSLVQVKALGFQAILNLEHWNTCYCRETGSAGEGVREAG